jgi:hypothetical protein
MTGAMSPTRTAQTTTQAQDSGGSTLLLQRKCACGGSAGLSGECEECRTKRLLGKPLQAKLRINEPGDEYEREADRVADQVMRMPDAPVDGRSPPSAATPLVQRSVRAGNVTDVGTAPSIVQDVLSSPGEPLDAATRAFFEPRFGHDFRQVRVHSDAGAAESAAAVDALAYTVGSHIVFGSALLAPGTTRGRRLLAHELSHVVQQHGVAMRREPELGMDGAAWAEQHAETTGAAGKYCGAEVLQRSSEGSNRRSGRAPSQKLLERDRQRILDRAGLLRIDSNQPWLRDVEAADPEKASDRNRLSQMFREAEARLDKQSERLLPLWKERIVAKARASGLSDKAVEKVARSRPDKATRTQARFRLEELYSKVETAHNLGPTVPSLSESAGVVHAGELQKAFESEIDPSVAASASPQPEAPELAEAETTRFPDLDEEYAREAADPTSHPFDQSRETVRSYTYAVEMTESDRVWLRTRYRELADATPAEIDDFFMNRAQLVAGDELTDAGILYTRKRFSIPAELSDELLKVQWKEDIVSPTTERVTPGWAILEDVELEDNRRFHRREGSDVQLFDDPNQTLRTIIETINGQPWSLANQPVEDVFNRNLDLRNARDRLAALANENSPEWNAYRATVLANAGDDDIARVLHEFQEDYARLEEFILNKTVGVKKPDLVEVFASRGSALVVDTTLAYTRLSHNIKTHFYAVVINEATGLETGSVDFKSMREMAILAGSPRPVQTPRPAAGPLLLPDYQIFEEPLSEQPARERVRIPISGRPQSTEGSNPGQQASAKSHPSWEWPPRSPSQQVQPSRGPGAAREVVSSPQTGSSGARQVPAAVPVQEPAPAPGAQRLLTGPVLAETPSLQGPTSGGSGVRQVPVAPPVQEPVTLPRGQRLLPGPVLGATPLLEGPTSGSKAPPTSGSSGGKAGSSGTPRSGAGAARGLGGALAVDMLARRWSSYVTGKAYEQGHQRVEEIKPDRDRSLDRRPDKGAITRQSFTKPLDDVLGVHPPYPPTFEGAGFTLVDGLTFAEAKQNYLSVPVALAVPQECRIYEYHYEWTPPKTSTKTPESWVETETRCPPKNQMLQAYDEFMQAIKDRLTPAMFREE